MRNRRHDYERPRALYMPRTRGALTGLLLILLGAWGALVPFFGPNIDWAYATDPAWTWTAAKGWLEVLPGSPRRWAACWCCSPATAQTPCSAAGWRCWAAPGSSSAARSRRRWASGTSANRRPRRT